MNPSYGRELIQEWRLHPARQGFATGEWEDVGVNNNGSQF